MRKPSMIAVLGAILTGATVAAPASHACADDDRGVDSSHDDEREDRDLVLDAVRRGKILPLPKLKAIVLKRWPGELVALSIGRKSGRIKYEFRILRGSGRLTEVEVDAATGSILEVENE